MGQHHVCERFQRADRRRGEDLLGARRCVANYAHLVIALLRARGVPARLVSVYAPGLEPMDFTPSSRPGWRMAGTWWTPPTWPPVRRWCDRDGPRRRRHRVHDGQHGPDGLHRHARRPSGNLNCSSMTSRSWFDCGEGRKVWGGERLRIRACRGPEEYPSLVAIWQRRGRHARLAAQDRAEIEAHLIPEYFPHVDLAIAERGGSPVGFAGGGVQAGDVVRRRTSTRQRSGERSWRTSWRAGCGRRRRQRAQRRG